MVITAPAVFQFTAVCCPDRHIEAAELLGNYICACNVMVAMVTGADVTNVKQEDAGRVLADILREYMATLMIPDGIQAFGYQRDDIPALVQGTLPQVRMKLFKCYFVSWSQQRVLKISPLPPAAEDIYKLLESSLKIY